MSTLVCRAPDDRVKAWTFPADGCQAFQMSSTLTAWHVLETDWSVLALHVPGQGSHKALFESSCDHTARNMSNVSCSLGALRASWAL